MKDLKDMSKVVQNVIKELTEIMSQFNSGKISFAEYIAKLEGRKA